ncbi:MAG: ATP-binding protein [Flavisolibacter sp.]
MPIRIRITLLFAGLACVILFLVCGGIYYFSYTGRLDTIKTRLINRAITTGRLLGQREVFDEVLVRRIDSSTTINMKNKIVMAFNDRNQLIYSYASDAGDALRINDRIINNARSRGSYFFRQGEREAIAFNYNADGDRFLMVAAGFDESGKENLAQLANILISAFLLGTILVFYTGYIFSKKLLAPIKKITDDVAEISAQNLARRIDTGNTRDEWFHLSDTLNQLLNRLQESFEMQRRFISNASHELSTPLTAISSQLEVSLQRPREAAEYRKVMESIYQDVQHMAKLTQTLLEFAKTSGTRGGLEIDLLRIDEILMSLPGEIVKLNHAYSVKLEFEDLPEEEGNLLVFGNELLLLTAIRNIVVNACKYSSDHKAIVSLRPDGQQLLVSITDKGPGIPDEEANKIFQPFYRSGDAPAEAGFGLGLSLADRIIKIHKGIIHLNSQPGSGTTFTISLPAASRLEQISG